MSAQRALSNAEMISLGLVEEADDLDKHKDSQGSTEHHQGAAQGGEDASSLTPVRQPNMMSSPEAQVSYLREKPVEQWDEEDDNLAVYAAQHGSEEAQSLHENYVTGGQGPMFDPEDEGTGDDWGSLPSADPATAQEEWGSLPGGGNRNDRTPDGPEDYVPTDDEVMDPTEGAGGPPEGDTLDTPEEQQNTPPGYQPQDPGVLDSPSEQNTPPPGYDPNAFEGGPGSRPNVEPFGEVDPDYVDPIADSGRKMREKKEREAREGYQSGGQDPVGDGTEGEAPRTAPRGDRGSPFEDEEEPDDGGLGGVVGAYPSRKSAGDTGSYGQRSLSQVEMIVLGLIEGDEDDN